MEIGNIKSKIIINYISRDIKYKNISKLNRID